MRTRKLIIFAIGVAVLAPGSAAQEIPDWTIDEICQSEGDRAACAEFESRAYKIVSGPWPTFSPDIRSACLQELRREQVKSYRMLQGCLKDEAFKEHRLAQQKRIAE